MLNKTDRQFLKQVAEEAVRAALTGVEHAPDLPAEGPLAEPGSAFVTLRRKGRLRGCVGMIGHSLPLGRAVREAAGRSLTDSRFTRMRARHLRGISVEISVLSPFRLLDDPDEIEVGRHGLQVRRGRSVGLLLPQVAVERGWDSRRFLEETCAKAGLSENSWRNPEVELRVFTAEVF